MKILCFILVLCSLVVQLGCQKSSEHLTFPSTSSTISTIPSPPSETTGELLQNPIPAPYNDILEDYRNLVEFRCSSSFEEKWNADECVRISDTLTHALSDPGKAHTTPDMPLAAKWSNMIVSMTNGVDDPQITSFGYLLKDINRDGSPELFWISDNKTILAIFTIQSNRVFLLDVFFPRHCCVVSEFWNLYTIDYGGAGFTHYEIRTLDSDGRLYPVIRFGSCGFTDEGTVIYYQTDGQEKLQISESAFEELHKLYPYIFCEEFLACSITYLRGN